MCPSAFPKVYSNRLLPFSSLCFHYATLPRYLATGSSDGVVRLWWAGDLIQNIQLRDRYHNAHTSLIRSKSQQPSRDGADAAAAQEVEGDWPLQRCRVLYRAVLHMRCEYAVHGAHVGVPRHPGGPDTLSFIIPHTSRRSAAPLVLAVLNPGADVTG